MPDALAQRFVDRREAGQVAGEVICAREPMRSVAIARWDYNLPEVTDSEVRALLSRARQALAAMQP